MATLENLKKDKWVVCHNGVDVFHTINLLKGQSLETGQPFVEEFDTEEQAKGRILELCPTFFDEEDNV